MFKKILAVLLTVTFTVMLFGCVQDNESDMSEVSRTEELSSDESDVSGESIETSEPEQDDANPYVSYEYDDLGRVAKEIEYDYYKEVRTYTEYEYDENGNCVKETCFYYDGIINYIIDREFNSAGREVVSICESMLSKSQVRREYYYDEAGKLSKITVSFTNQMCDQEEIYDSDEKLVTRTYLNSDGTLAAFEEYDKNGHMTKHIQYDSDGSIRDILESVFDRKGRQVESLSYDKDGKLEWRTEYEYDNTGNYIRIVGYDSEDNRTHIYEKAYDDAGRTIRDAHYDADGKLIYLDEKEYEYSDSGEIMNCSNHRLRNGEMFFEYTEYIRDESENLLKVLCYNEDGVITYGSACEYDENGRRIKFLSYNSDGSYTTSNITKYNDDGTYEVIVLNTDGTISMRTVYNENGRSLEQTWYYSNGQLKQCVKEPTKGFKEVIKYDEEGNFVSHEVVEKNGMNKETKRIEYDSDGNIIKYVETEFDIYGCEIKSTSTSGEDSSKK